MMPTSPDEIAQLVEDLRTGVSDDPTMARCRTASEAMRFAAELVSERQELISALRRLDQHAKDCLLGATELGTAAQNDTVDADLLSARSLLASIEG